MRLGVYADMAYRRDGETLSARQAFVRFVAALPPRVDEVVLFGRVDPEPGRAAYVLPADGVRFVALPHYPRVSDVPAMIAALPRTRTVFAAQLDRVDAVLVFGPHPVALMLAHTARRRGTPLVLGVRQDYPAYIRHRLPGAAWVWAGPAADALDTAFRALARDAPTVALGAPLARRYATAGGAGVLELGFSLVPEREVVSTERALARDWDAERELLAVGRLDPEKDPLALLEVLAALRARDGRWRLTIAGDGPLRERLEAAVAERGLAGAVRLLGDVPNGPALWARYRASHAFVHLSRTEGLPQVLVEAHAAGLPVVATRVGGVGAALGQGVRGLLVEPGDTQAAVVALERLATDRALRRRLILAGLEHARDQSLERQLDRLATFAHAAATATSSHRYRSNASVRNSPATR